MSTSSLVLILLGVGSLRVRMGKQLQTQWLEEVAVGLPEDGACADDSSLILSWSSVTAESLALPYFVLEVPDGALH